MKGILCALWIALSLSACATAPKEKPLCVDNDHPSGAISCVNIAAKEMWLFAQIANNVYDDDKDRPKFELPPSVSIASKPVSDWTGFKAQAFQVAPSVGEPYIVIAYAGTDNTPDWLFGNLIPIQNRRGREFFNEIKATHPDKRIVVTGHSLGGAISKHVATRAENVRGYVFNPSLVATSGPYAGIDTIRSISQYAEVLGVVRKPMPNGPGTYTVLGCRKSGPIERHSIRYLAECLTHIAAWDSSEAENSLLLNGLNPRKRIDRSTNTLVLDP